MMAIGLPFRGFASISGTADAGHTKQFAGKVKTDAGVLDTAGYKRNNNTFTVKTALVETSGHPKELSHTDFQEYKKWYDKVSDDQRANWGDSESFSYKHSDNSFYTAMQHHSVHYGKGLDFGLFVWGDEPARSLALSNSAYKVKRRPNSGMTDQAIIDMFDPYARAHGEAFNEQGISISVEGGNNTIPSVTVDTTQPRQAPPARGDKQGEADEYNYGIMFAANDVYTATAGDSHEAVMYLSHIASSVKWYVDTTLIETDSNTDEPRMSWSIPESASGDYVIKAEVTPSSGASYEGSYTLSVTASTPVETTPSTPTLSYSLVSSDGVYTATAGTGHEANFTASQAYDAVSWYLKRPSDTSAVYQRTDSGNGSSTTSQFSYTFASSVSGDYVFRAKGTIGSTGFEESYTVSVSLPSSSTTTPTSTPTPTPTVSLPVWSDIPDPYNLTVGESFTLNFSSYVTGSPTLTWGGGRPPAGLRFRNGVLSGTVTSVESRGIRVQATNSAGSVYSEWVQIYVTAP